jgi:hypothetical protein
MDLGIFRKVNSLIIYKKIQKKLGSLNFYANLVMDN